MLRSDNGRIASVSRTALQSAPKYGRLVAGRSVAVPKRSSCRAAIAPLVTEQEAIASSTSAAARVGGFFLPPVTDAPEALLHQNVPFLTTNAGALPVKPQNLGHALDLYGSYTSKYVSVRVENVHVKLRSWDHAVESLQAAESSKKPYWCSLIEDVRHPNWWPTAGPVPTYDQAKKALQTVACNAAGRTAACARSHNRDVIFGRGNASIGLHFDKDNACAGGSRRPVSTYLAICAGRKLTLLLPPDQTLLPPGGDPELLLRPPPGFLEQVKAAGGYYFMLEDLTLSTSQGASDGRGGSSSGDWRSNWRTSSSSSGVDDDWRSNWRSSSNGADNSSSSSVGSDWRSKWRTSSSTPAGSSTSSSSDWRSNWRTSNRSSHHDASTRCSSEREAQGSQQATTGSPQFSATALYMPSGWYHWLVGLSDWHVVYGGSFYPEQQEWMN